jgi:hypothetical protein
MNRSQFINASPRPYSSLPNELIALFIPSAYNRANAVKIGYTLCITTIRSQTTHHIQQLPEIHLIVYRAHRESSFFFFFKAEAAKEFITK